MESWLTAGGIAFSPCDGKRCLGCGKVEERPIVVPHRLPEVARLRSLVTLCRRCQAALHHTYRPGYGFPAQLYPLRRERHRQQPEQLPLLGSNRSCPTDTSQVTLLEAT